MENRNKDYISIAIQKSSGKLHDGSVSLLKSAGLIFNFSSDEIVTKCQNADVYIYQLRDDDIPFLTSNGHADIGIASGNVIDESGYSFTARHKLGFAKASIAIAVPKNSNISSVEDLENIPIATKFPNITKAYFDKKKINLGEIIKLSGAVEIAHFMGLADAIVEVSSTGNSLRLFEYKVIETMQKFDTELIINSKNIREEKLKIVEELVKKLVKK